MELEFDKEMDSLLRKTGEAGRGVLIGDKPGETRQIHLDADQLSAVAENAIPERSRALYISHLADCDRCRRILSGLIMLNAEAMPAEERVTAPLISPGAVEPWYRRLLLPNLAYVMGGLVLVFGGLIAISVFQFSDSGEATVSQSTETAAPAARGPMFEEGQAVTDQMANTNASSMIANKPAAIQSANAASNSASAASNTTAAGTGADLLAKETSPRDEPGYSLDGLSAAKPAAAAPVAAPPPPMSTAVKREDSETSEVTVAAELKDADRKARTVDKKSEGEKADASISARKVEDLPITSRQMQGLSRNQAGGVAKSTPGPSRDNAQNFPNRANNTSELFEEKRVSGKGFQRRNNVWYDNSYRGGATTNVRRGTDEYKKLDGGLRSIAESLSGVVVVVWSGKAYRIQ